MAKRQPATNRDKLRWKPVCHRMKAGLRLRVYNDSTHQYRINEFRGVENLPFIVIIIAKDRDHEQISRHATLEEAKVACERHLRERAGG